jgi:hypothetical protein
MKKSTLFMMVILAVSTLACTITIPIKETVTREVQTFEIKEDLEDVILPPLELEINMGAGELIISKTSGKLLTGTIEYNFDALKPSLTRMENEILISQTEDVSASLPIGKLVNKWDLQIGDVATDLTLNAGAYHGVCDLTGIPLTSLIINDGASNNDIVFKKLNPVDMEQLSYTTGASNVSMKGLANANFSFMSFTGGAGSYLLDFGGSLNRDAVVEVDLGVGSMTIIIPDGISANIRFNGELTNVEFEGAWDIEEGIYKTNGQGPVLEMVININLGKLTLIHQD